MKDLLGLMGKAKEMQAKFQAMQEEIAGLEATGQAGGGLVRVTLSGKFEIKSLKIDPSLFKEDDVEVLEDLFVPPTMTQGQGRADHAGKDQGVDGGLADTAGDEAAVLSRQLAKEASSARNVGRSITPRGRFLGRLSPAGEPVW